MRCLCRICKLWWCATLSGRVWVFVLRLPLFSWSKALKDLAEKRVSYSGAVVSVRRDLVAKLVVAVWPKVGSACVCDITQFVDEHLRDDLLNPQQCLLSQEFWPPQPRLSKVHASDAEWYEVCKAGFERGMFQVVPENEIFTDAGGHKVLAGAMGVDKPKVVDGQDCMFLRFIAILTPINAYLRKMRGDSSTLPQASLLSMLILEDDEVALVNSEDLESCFTFSCRSLGEDTSSSARRWREPPLVCRRQMRYSLACGWCPWDGLIPWTSSKTSFGVSCLKHLASIPG